MPTLEQLAPSGRTQQATITTASGAGVAPTVETPASKLAGDLLGIVGQTSRTAQQVNTLSVGAAKRVAIQNLTDMSKDLEAIKANAEPGIDPRELQAANMAVYQHYGKIKFDNADAQEAFDSMYHLSGSKAIARQNSILEQQANLNDHKALTASIEDSLASQLQIGIEQSKDMIDSYVEGITSGGYENKDQAYKRLSDILNINLNKHHEVNRNLQIYIDGKVDSTSSMGLWPRSMMKEM